MEWEIVMNQQYTAPTITIGGNCAQSQELIVDILQDAIGGRPPMLKAASGYMFNWQATGGIQPTVTTVTNGRDGFKFQLSTYPTGNNLILWAWLPTTAPSYAAPGGSGRVVRPFGFTLTGRVDHWRAHGR
jgi:hypothetical protein